MTEEQTMDNERENITIEGIIGGIGSPFGEGAEYEYASLGEYSHLDNVGKERLKNDLEKLIIQAEQRGREEERQRIREKVEGMKEPEPVMFELAKLRNETLDQIIEALEEQKEEA